MTATRTAARLHHGSLAVVVLASLVTQIVLTAQGAPDPTGVVQPAVTRFVRLFGYFTIQSNILLLIVSVTLAMDPGRDGRLWRVVRLDAILGIVITGLVYATVLAGTADPRGAGWWSNLGFHYVAHWWALLGWLVFGPRSRTDRRTMSWAVLWPVAWIGWTFASGAATGWYPYPFTDVSRWGYPAVLINLGMVVLLAVVLGTVLHLLDTRLPGRSPAVLEPTAVVVPKPGSGVESVGHRDM